MLLIFLLAFPLASVITGCRTAPTLAPVDLADPGWRVHHGQALWRPKEGAPELAGRILIAANSSGEEFIRFSKDPIEIVLAQCDRRGWRLSMSMLDKTYSGHGRPPRRIGWFRLAEVVFGDSEPRDWNWSGIVEGRWCLENTRTGERFEGLFNE